jgi:hypothetical protein
MRYVPVPSPPSFFRGEGEGPTFGGRTVPELVVFDKKLSSSDPEFAEKYLVYSLLRHQKHQLHIT